ncbi:MAG TPA: hypothetical protein VIV60_21895, partial [Polyangiaceae bacterium]
VCIRERWMSWTNGLIACLQRRASTGCFEAPSGVVRCESDTCGAGGYCSYIRNASGATVIGCTWPG